MSTCNYSIKRRLISPSSTIIDVLPSSPKRGLIYFGLAEPTFTL